MIQGLSNIVGAKWQILQQIDKGFTTPKEVAEKLGISISNASQQMKFLEAWGYLKKERVDKGPGGRKKSNKRVSYKISKNQDLLVSIHDQRLGVKNIKETPLNQIFLNSIQHDLGEEQEYLVALYFDLDKGLSEVRSIHYLKTTANEIHLLLVSENPEHFRHQQSKRTIKTAKGSKTIVFWSHTQKELDEGLERKEDYFVNQMKLAKLIMRN